jgi:3-isopropylmalate dehydrogenase
MKPYFDITVLEVKHWRDSLNALDHASSDRRQKQFRRIESIGPALHVGIEDDLRFGSEPMALRYSFGMLPEADMIEQAIAAALATGLRTADIASAGTTTVGMAAMGDAIIAEMAA